MGSGIVSVYQGGRQAQPRDPFQPQASAPRTGGGSILDAYGAAPLDTTPLPDSQVTDVDDGVDDASNEPSNLVPGAVAGAAALGGTAWLLSKLKGAPGVMGKIGKGAEYVNSARQQLMLSGLALPKSLLGNAGAAVTASLERGSTRPLREMFSGQTVKDAIAAYRQNAGALQAGANTPRGVALPGPMPGRFMGAFDEAAQGALKRAGLSARDAEREVLQSPLPPQLADALDSPIARYIHPFRRTPFNQFLEGLRTLPGAKGGTTGAKAAYIAAGGVHGAATADDDTPLSVPVAMAGAGRYGYTYGLAALLARLAAGGKGDADIPSGMLPVSEYGITQSVEDPLRPFTKPAALTALEKMAR